MLDKPSQQTAGEEFGPNVVEVHGVAHGTVLVQGIEKKFYLINSRRWQSEAAVRSAICGGCKERAARGDEVNAATVNAP